METLSGTSVLVTRLCKTLQKATSILVGQQARNCEFPDVIIFASMFNDITKCELKKVQTK